MYKIFNDKNHCVESKIKGVTNKDLLVTCSGIHSKLEDFIASGLQDDFALAMMFEEFISGLFVSDAPMEDIEQACRAYLQILKKTVQHNFNNTLSIQRGLTFLKDILLVSKRFSFQRVEVDCEHFVKDLIEQIPEDNISDMCLIISLLVSNKDIFGEKIKLDKEVYLIYFYMQQGDFGMMKSSLEDEISLNNEDIERRVRLTQNKTLLIERVSFLKHVFYTLSLEGLLTYISKN